MRLNAITAAVLMTVVLTTADAMGQTPPSPPRPQVQQDGLTWEVRYLVDTSQDAGGISQFDSPRSNRGVGVSPDGRYLYLGYNEPNGSPVAGRHDHQVRVIDTLVEDFTDSVVAILNRHRGKSIAVDDAGRVYVAEGSDSDVHLGAGGIHIFDASLGVELAVIPIGATYGLAKPEGVTVRREAGVLALYATDRSTKKLYRFVISEGPGFAITAITKAGLYTGIGEALIPGAVDLRGVKIETAGRIWMADLAGNQVIRCESDASACLATGVAKAMDIGLLGQRAFVTQYTAPVSPTITVLRQSDMVFDSLLVAPWSALKLDPVGQKQPVPNGPFLGNFAGTGFVRLPNGDKILYFSNERGQTEFEKSVYGRCDEFSDNPGGPCVFADLAIDDNEPVFKIVEPNRTIGDFVWVDTDGDGIQDAGEPGIENVSVTLTGPGGVQTTTTDADGLYLFSDLLEGTYTVTVAAPVGYTASPAGAPGSTPANDSNGSIATVTLGPGGNSDLTIDFGFVPPASGIIGDFVWSDLNGNGIQEVGEPGLENILVTLDGPGGAQMAFTDATGFYQFTGLSAGSYSVTAATPPGTSPSPTAALGSNSANDSNGSPAAVTLATNSSSDFTIDFGFVMLPTGALGDFVWSDTNANGLQDSGEPGISGVTVQLKNSSGTVIQTTTTNASGVYLFTGLGAGTYTVVVTTPPSYTASPSNAGTDTAIDSNGSPATVTLATNSSTDQTIDFGLVSADVCVPVTFIFTGSSATSGSAGNLRTFTSGGVSVKASAFSRVDSSGSWSTAFLGLYGPGLGVTDGSEGNGSDDRHKVDNVGGRNNYVLFEFSSPVVVNQAFLDYIGSDSDLSVWIGTTADPYNNHLTLSDALLATLVREDHDTTSTANSRWADLNSSERVGNVLIIASSASDTTPDDGFKLAKLALSCVPGSDPGEPPTGTIGNFVWNDLNANGIQDSGEPGLANVTVKLKNSTGVVIQTDTTDSAGFYLFASLPAGSYTVVVSMPSGFVATTSGASGSTIADDSNGSPAAVTLATNASVNLTIDFGFVTVATGYSTYTQGGWGSKPSGNNPGALLRDNFAQVYPIGFVKVGGTKTLKFTSQKAIQVFLPQGSKPNVLLATRTNPTGSASGVFGGQVLALRLSVDFSNSGVTKAGLGDLILVTGPLAGYTVDGVLALANTVLGGTKSALPAGVTVSKLNAVVDAINNNFDNGTNNGYLR